MTNNEPKIIWVSAHSLIEEQTRQIERQFSSSRPKPRHRAMGFKAVPKKVRDITDPDDWDGRRRED